MSECCHAAQRPAYLKKAALSALFAFILIVLNGFHIIPSPMTPLGGFIGLSLAFVTASIMKYSGGPYYQSAFEALKKKKTNMNTLVALSTGIAWFYSVLMCLSPQLFPTSTLHYHFSEVGMILGVVNVGRWRRFKAEAAIKKQTQSYLNIFNKYQPSCALRFKLEQGGLGAKIKIEDIEKGDILQIHPGERFPVEGVIISCANDTPIWVDQKNITGESLAVQKKIGDMVLTGSLNKTGTFRIRASVKGVDNNLQQLLKVAQHRTLAKRSDSELIDKITRYFIPTILIIALITAGSWLWLAPVASEVLPLMVQSMMSVLLCACPCALGLAVPMSTSVSIHKLLEKGILVKNASSFEKASSIDTLIFDKTGTLTQPHVESLYFPEQSFTSAQMLDYVASLEKHHARSHPYAKALIKKITRTYPVEKAVTDDQGMTGLVNQTPLMVGSLNYCLEKGAQISPIYKEQAQILNEKGQTTIFVISNLKCVGVIGLTHQLQENAKTQMEILKKRGIQVGLLTGDKKGPAQSIAKALELDPSWVWYEQNAQQKSEIIKCLKQKRQAVAMVGDGMNDILACEQADIGFAMQAWTNAAVKCDVALQGSIEDIVKFLETSKVVNKNIKQNIGWTFAYNIVALMGATGLLYPILSCALNPILAATLMACSSIIVILNAKRLPRLIDKALKTTVSQEVLVSPAPCCCAQVKEKSVVVDLKKELEHSSKNIVLKNKMVI